MVAPATTPFFVTARASKEESKAKLLCSLGVETVSNDDDESLGFDVALARTWDPTAKAFVETLTLEGVVYSGSFSFLEKETQILGLTEAMEAPGWKAALTAQEGRDPNKNPLGLLRAVLDAVTPLCGEKVRSEEVSQPVAVKSVFAMVDEKMTTSGSLALGSTGRLKVELPEVSLLATPGEPRSGFLAPSAMTAALKARLPQ